MGREQVLIGRKLTQRTIRMNLIGANPDARLQPQGAVSGSVNYLIGNDPKEWRRNVQRYQRINATSVYPGIDLVYYGNQDRLEFDFNVAPQAHPELITLRYDGADKITITKKGELVIDLGDQQVRQPAPEIYQVIDDQRRTVSGGYKLKDSKTVTFALGTYDPAYPLVIDPVLAYSTYFGGSGNETAVAVKVRADGIYVAGQTLSPRSAFPEASGFQSQFGGGAINGDAFVAKFGPAGTNLVYFTYLGGSYDDGALDLAIDGDGDAYIAGFTGSPNFPTKFPTPAPGPGLTNGISGRLDPTLHIYPTDAFVAELDAAGANLIFSTYLGGSLADVGIGVAIDGQTNVYVTGYTYSTNDFPVMNAFRTRCSGSNDVFVSKIAAGGSNLVYSTYLGGTNVDEGQGIAATNGRAFVTGYTYSTNFPTKNALQPEIDRATNGAAQFKNRLVSSDAFIAVIDTTTNGAPSLLYSSFLGGTNHDAGYRITLDSAANAWITGNSNSRDLPLHTNALGALIITNGTSISNSINYDALLTKFGFISGTNGLLTATNFFSFAFGGRANDVGWDIALDPSGNVFITGVSRSPNFPITNAFGSLGTTNKGVDDAFITAFDSSVSTVLFSALLGGTNNDYGFGIAADQSTNVYVVGQTYSSDFPGGIIPALQAGRAGTNADAFLAILIPEVSAPVLTPVAVGTNFQVSWSAFAPQFMLQTSTNIGPAANWIPVEAAPVTANGWLSVTLPATNAAQFFRLKR